MNWRSDPLFSNDLALKQMTNSQFNRINDLAHNDDRFELLRKHFAEDPTWTTAGRDGMRFFWKKDFNRSSYIVTFRNRDRDDLRVSVAYSRLADDRIGRIGILWRRDGEKVAEFTVENGEVKRRDKNLGAMTTSSDATTASGSELASSGLPWDGWECTCEPCDGFICRFAGGAVCGGATVAATAFCGAFGASAQCGLAIGGGCAGGFEDGVDICKDWAAEMDCPRT